MLFSTEAAAPKAGPDTLMKSRVLTVAEMLRQRVEAGLHLGTLAPGARLASIRALSAELHASPRLVLAAYRRLAAEGLVQLRNRSGVFVPVP
jgi:GntR family transcriptional regulator/MocR family aminotransferase